MKKIRLLFILLLFFIPFTLMAQPWRDGYGCLYPGMGFGKYFGFGGGLMLIFFAILIGLLVLFGVKIMKGQGNPFSLQDPIAVLKGRYAKGEISKEQFQEMKKDLI